MKICIISNLYPPNVRGGAERLASFMADELARIGNDVIVISTKEEKGTTIESTRNIKIYRFRPMNLFYYLNDYKHNFLSRLIWRFIDTFNFSSFFTIKKILKKENPDIVITHNLVGLGLLTPIAIKALKIRHFHLIHDVQLVVPSGLLLDGQEQSFLATGFPTKIYGAICKILFRNIETIISPSDWLLDFYKSKKFFKNSKTKIIRNPIATSSTKVEAKNHRTNNYLFLGQLEKHKGILWLVEFWKKNNIQEKLYIAGWGSIDISGYTNDNIIFLGKKTTREMEDIYKTIDFQIVPTLCYENSPMIIPQSFQNATPVICADIGGTAELVTDDTGYKFICHDTNSFLQKLDIARSQSEQDYIDMSRNCIAKSAELTLKRYIEQLQCLIRD